MSRFAQPAIGEARPSGGASLPALNDPAALRAIPLFEMLSGAELAAINEKLRRRNFPSGTNVISVETPGEVVYVILSGTVKIKVDQADGTEVIIAMLGAGEIFGELSVLDSAGRSADVLTQEDSVLLWLDRSSFEQLVDEFPSFTKNLLRLLTRRVRLSTEQIQALCTLDVYGKVSRQLLVFADQYGEPVADGVMIPMRLTQSDIAGLVGASRERVNQVFVNLRNRNLITSDTSYRITVKDKEKLRHIVQQR
jgi:CRP/FNR family cyclic AMP-dependent transcriptional regulator